VPVSIKEVAAQAGVSIGTVSNVLNRPDVVAPATRERVLAAIASLGFVRNEAARSLRVGRSRTVGLVVLDVANPFFTDVAAGVETVADQHGATITLCNSGERRERESRHLEHLEEQRVQGVLITPVDTRSAEVDRLVGRGIPVVLVDRGAGRRDRCSVAVNDIGGGRLIGEHLAERGHRRVAFVGGPMSIKQVSDRRRGLSQALAASGQDVDLTVLESRALSIAEGTRLGHQLAQMTDAARPTAVSCANDLLALGLLQALTTAGLRVPHDVAIVGYDDIVYAEAAAVPLSSVRQPREQLGRTAAELLFEEIDGAAEHRHRRVVFAPELVVRASSGSSRGSDRRRSEVPAAGTR
jgi:DNA-binding LacI/PurR family transcriptional regulator